MLEFLDVKNTTSGHTSQKILGRSDQDSFQK